MIRTRLAPSPAPLGLALLAWAASAAAAPPEARPDELEAAEQAYANLDYAAANAAAERLARQGNLAHDQLVRTTRLLALTHAALDRPAAARDAFVALLAYDPGFQLDAKLGPRFHDPYFEAKGFWKAQSVKPGLEAGAQLRGRSSGFINVTLRDPTHLAQRVQVAYRWAPARGFATQTLEAGEGQLDVPAPPEGSTRLDYYAQALNGRGDVVFQAGSAAAPKTSLLVDLGGGRGAPVDRRGEGEGGGGLLSKPLFWVVTAAVVAGGAVGGYFLFADQNGDKGAGGRWAPALNCGGTACR
ncbi:MAG TPA: hypothetical protein VFS00_28395 [Polyangiaceae bacterium]|nr:hypothetical protein [Polyangiaceae bacterium]